LGSFFAGVKAGTLAGIAYLGGLAFFNVALMYAFKPAVLNLIQGSYSQVCSQAANSNATSLAVEDCFSSILIVYIPLVAFLGFTVALVFSGVFGGFYESFPGRTSTAKGELLGAMVGVSLLLLNLAGVYFDAMAKAAVVAFLVVWTGVYGVLIGRLYERYTKSVQFVSQDGRALRIRVDGHDFTGKTRTFAMRSTHDVRAEVGGGGAFRGWAASGGVKVEDSKSFETTIEIEGNGMLKAQVSPKS
jgi:hypothetical protein